MGVRWVSDAHVRSVSDAHVGIAPLQVGVRVRNLYLIDQVGVRVVTGG